MTQHPFRRFIEKLVPLTDEEWADVESRLHTLSYKKDEFITREGDTEKYLYFITTGVHRLYYLDQAGNESILGFSFDNNISGVFDSFMQQKPSAYYLQALTDTEMLGISLPDLNELFDRYKSMERWGRLFLQQILFGRGRRELEMLSMTAEERYHIFMSRIPVHLQNIPLKYIASYLNMSPETLSRVRAKKQ